MTDSPPTARPISARLYMKTAAAKERAGRDGWRRRLLEGLHGRVLEIGAGSGLSFQHYPRAVTEVVAVEPESTMRAAAREAATRAHVPVRVLAGSAADVPLGDGSADAVVASLVLCSVNDPARAIAEIMRVLSPEGELRFYEHVASRRAPLRALQRAADATAWPRLSGGCHLGRDTVGVLEHAGLAVEVWERSGGEGLHIPPKTFVLGTARRR